MPRVGRDRPLTAAVWGFAALLAAALSAGQARAECGDYVHIGPAAPSHSATDAPGSPGRAADDTAPVKRPVPCHGPNCSLRNTPSTPLVPPTPPAEPGPSDAILTADPPADPDPADRPFTPSVHLPVGPSAGIFHPPRLG